MYYKLYACYEAVASAPWHSHVANNDRQKLKLSEPLQTACVLWQRTADSVCEQTV